MRKIVASQMVMVENQVVCIEEFSDEGLPGDGSAVELGHGSKIVIPEGHGDKDTCVRVYQGQINIVSLQLYINDVFG